MLLASQMLRQDDQMLLANKVLLAGMLLLDQMGLLANQARRQGKQRPPRTQLGRGLPSLHLRLPGARKEGNDRSAGSGAGRLRASPGQKLEHGHGQQVALAPPGLQLRSCPFL
ncbi:unnamed protein product [Prorocentrum cordatum]|uniref:Uncharacterized protein n=1 Tax=Prorocentrum cordatum TaxID=2364126 RepID=A0ABN9SME3_9DINO|nr:unnamed protein product [Polarella glacialis]